MIAIFGGGIAGLSAAYELGKLGHEVHLYEANDGLGGLCRSTQGAYFSEHSWRGFAPFYTNIFDLFDEIGIDRSDALIDLSFENPRDDGGSAQKLSTTDVFKILRVLLTCKDEDVFTEKIENVISPEGYHFIVKMLCPGFGVDPRTFPAKLMKHYLDLNFAYFPTHKWKVLRGPSSEVFIEPLANRCREKGVKIHLDTPLEEIVMSSGSDGQRSIEHCIADGNIVRADEFIMALNPYNLDQILNESEMTIDETKFINPIADTTPAIEVGFSMTFDEDIMVSRDHGSDTPAGVLMLPDSEYDITLIMQSDKFHSRYVRDVIGDPSREMAILSGTACDAYTPGSVTGLPLSELSSKEQFISEIHDQIGRNEGLKKIWGDDFMDHVVKTKVWREYSFDHRGAHSTEPHWITTVDNFRGMPDQATTVKNMWLAGSYTKTDIRFFSMEGACESGRRAARMIDSRCVVMPHTIMPAVQIYVSLIILIILLVIAAIVYLISLAVRK